jgi:beta-glucuronidase
MQRLFPRHQFRATWSLDGFWDFAVATDNAAAPPRSFPQAVYVPSAWETTPGLENYRGVAWCRRRVVLPGSGSGMALRLLFGGVSHLARVLVDGKECGAHEDAFTPWDVVVPVESDTAELAVEVDNRFGPRSALHIENDYYTYGGITRPVEAQLVPPVFVERVHAVPRRVRKGGWTLDITVRLRNWTDQPHDAHALCALGDSTLDFGSVSVAPNDRMELRGVLTAPAAVVAWSPDSPVLYALETFLEEDGQPVDDVVERLGFREVAVKGKRLLLNGEPIRLRGFNRHEDHPQFGCALPVEAMVNDLALVRDMGGNFVRTCHYPNDQRFLDLCDELGLLVWEESHARTVSFDHPRFGAQIEASTREMVDWHRNHPCIILWGCLNECDSTTPGGRDVHARVLGQLRAADGSRPVTFASNKLEKDVCLELADIVSFNVYTGWYGGTVADIEARLKQLLGWVHSDASGARGKPVILSEFGGAALYGVRQPRHSKWSEEYQRDLLDEALRVYVGHPDVVGAAIWQFADCRVTDGFFGSRARTCNNKGVVDDYRRPKLSYEVVQRRFRESAEHWQVALARVSSLRAKRVV